MTNEEKFKEIFGITTGRLYNMPSSCFHKWESEKCAEQRTGRWIPCKRRLPNDDEPFEVYCCDTHGEQLIAHPFEDKNSDTGFSAESEGCFMYDCIAWMPPFEPYKESKNE